MHPASGFSGFCPQAGAEVHPSAQEGDSAGHPTPARCTPYQPVHQEGKNRKTSRVLFCSDAVVDPAWGSRDLLPAAVEGHRLQG